MGFEHRAPRRRKARRQLQQWCSLETTQPPHLQMKPVKPSQHLSCFLKGNLAFWTFPRSFSNALPSVLTTLIELHKHLLWGNIWAHTHMTFGSITNTYKENPPSADKVCRSLWHNLLFIRPPLPSLHFPCFQVSLYQVSAIPRFWLFCFKGHD